jgi:hypothetical protein
VISVKKFFSHPPASFVFRLDFIHCLFSIFSLGLFDVIAEATLNSLLIINMIQFKILLSAFAFGPIEFVYL